MGGGNEEPDPAAESKAGRRETGTGGSRRGERGLQVWLPECVGEKHGEHLLLRGSETKGRVQPATHLSRTRAGRSRLPENAEVGKQTTTPRRLSGLPAYDSQVPAVGSAGFSRTDYNSLWASRADVTRPAHCPQKGWGQLRATLRLRRELERRLVSVFCCARCTVQLIPKMGKMFFRFRAFLGGCGVGEKWVSCERER